MKLFYRDITKKDLPEYERRSKSEFLPTDFCSERYLLRNWEHLKGFLLLNDKQEWIGCCFLSFKSYVYNPGGAHFLELIVFPEFQGQGYAKYLYKLLFDHSIGYQKSVCINPVNKPSIALALKYAFIKGIKRKTWHVYTCDKEYYPAELSNLPLFEK